jgi:hypothetical protein
MDAGDEDEEEDEDDPDSSDDELEGLLARFLLALGHNGDIFTTLGGSSITTGSGGVILLIADSSSHCSFISRSRSPGVLPVRVRKS